MNRFWNDRDEAPHIKEVHFCSIPETVLLGRNSAQLSAVRVKLEMQIGVAQFDSARPKETKEKLQLNTS